MGPSGKWIPGICPEGSVADAARVSLDARLGAVIHWLPLAAYHAQQDSEHVHRLRVATRRAVAAIDLYKDWLPGKRASRMKKRLKKIRRAAGDARDLDVLAERLRRESNDRASAVLPIVMEKRDEAQSAIVEVAERCRRDDRFVRKVASLLDRIQPQLANHRQHQPAVFRDWAKSQLASVTDAFFAVSASDSADAAALHQFRIRGKALRYAIELLAPAFGSAIREQHYPVIEELQERLGKINDHVTAAVRIRAWIEEADDAHRDTLQALLNEEAQRQSVEMREFGDWWTKERCDCIKRGLSDDLLAA